jgi:hypothetical protein
MQEYNICNKNNAKILAIRRKHRLSAEPKNKKAAIRNKAKIWPASKYWLTTECKNKILTICIMQN